MRICLPYANIMLYTGLDCYGLRPPNPPEVGMRTSPIFCKSTLGNPSTTLPFSILNGTHLCSRLGRVPLLPCQIPISSSNTSTAVTKRGWLTSSECCAPAPIPSTVSASSLLRGMREQSRCKSSNWENTRPKLGLFRREALDGT